MKFHIAWNKLSQENVLLKYIIAILVFICAAFAIGILRLALRSPLVIERGCSSRTVTLQNSKPTSDELLNFSREALSRRFNEQNQKNDSTFLSSDELKAKNDENILLKKKNISQAVIVRKINFEKNSITAEIDRVFAMGDSRPAYASKIGIEVLTTSRSEENPYGLILNKVTFNNEKEMKKNE